MLKFKFLKGKVFQFKEIRYFYSILRYRIILALLLSILVGLLDGIGLTMFMPLLEMISEGEGEMDNGEQLGGLSFILDGVRYLGITINLTNTLLIIAMFFSLKGVFYFLQKDYAVIVQQYFIKKVRFSSIKMLSQFRYQSFVTEDVGRIQNAMTLEVGRISNALKNYIQTIQAILLLLVYVVLAAMTNTDFAILVGLGAMVTNVLYRYVYKVTKRVSKSISAGNNDFQGLIIQLLNNFKYLKATGAIRVYKKYVERAIDLIEGWNRKIGRINAFLVSSREPLVIVIICLVIFVQINVLEERLDGILLSMLFFYRALNGLSVYQNSWNQFLNLHGSLENMRDFEEVLYNGLEQSSEAEGELGTIKSIEYKNISYGYDTTMVLKNINFKINRGQTVAFVGESGSGKSTLINLMCGLLSANDGTILFNNISIDTLSRKSLSKKIGYITQEPVVFNDTLKNNISLWDSVNSKLNYRDVLNLAHIHTLSYSTEEQDSLLGSNGSNLSGGQRQRVSIAREMFKSPELLIMDEATSALDSDTEAIISDNISREDENRITVIVAHRISTIEQADKIFVLDAGKIVDAGRHDELLQSSEVYQRLNSLKSVEDE